jgi:putative NIF3 family GTP cyclohydrolase 1 type 2
VVAGGPAEIRSFGIVTGAGQRLLEDAVRGGLAMFVTGEANEQAAHIAREEGIHFVSAGHHATERFGVQALGRYVTETFGVETEFVEIQNPI